MKVFVNISRRHFRKRPFPSYSLVVVVAVHVVAAGGRRGAEEAALEGVGAGHTRLLRDRARAVVAVVAQVQRAVRGQADHGCCCGSGGKIG